MYGGTVNEEKKETIKVMPAQSFDEDIAGAYVATTSNLKLRAGANTKYDVLASVPKGGKVQCYGYYTKESGGTVWLYVVYNEKVGFISKRYLLSQK